MQNFVYLNHTPMGKYFKKGIEIYTKEDTLIDVIFTGEIYNSEEICTTLMIDYIDSEHTIKSAYEAYGIEETIRILDGNYTFILIDHSILLDTAKIFIARDLIGIYPLYLHTIPIGYTKETFINSPTILKRLDIMNSISYEPYNNYVISSEKTIEGGISKTCSPGSYSEFSLSFLVNAKWRFEGETRVSMLAIMPLLSQNIIFDYYSRTLHQILEQSIEKRIRYSDTVICVANDVYGNCIAKVARKLCILSNKHFKIEKKLTGYIEVNTVILHTGFIENLFQIKEINPVIENRVIRDFIEYHNLYHIKNIYHDSNSIQFPFWDIMWIQFYMTMPNIYRIEYAKKFFI